MTVVLPRSDTTNLTGGRLVFARLLWVAITVYAIGLFGVIVYQFVQAGSSGGDFGAALASLGLPANALTVFTAALGVIEAGVFCSVALFLYLHKSSDWMTTFVSLVLITFGCYGGNALPVSQMHANPGLRYLIGPVLGLSNGLFVAFLYCMPDGRFVPRWLRWPVLAFVALSFVLTFDPTSPLSPFSWSPAVSFLFFLAAYSGSVPVQGYRMRHYHTAAQNQQIKWIIFALLIALAAGYVLPFWPPLMFPELAGTGVPGLTFAAASRLVGMFAIVTFPVLLAFSVRRYRLWEVDAMIHRGAVYGALTALLVVLFIASVLGVQMLAQHISGGMQSGIGLLIAGVAFGALFNPARRWVRALVDRRMYGIQVDYHTPARQAAPPQVGRVQAGTRLGIYEVLEPIGRGGMAEVYKGNHSSLGRTVAIKVLPPDLAEQPDFRKRFEREAHMIASLKHPNIVQLFDFGEVDGTYYMVMEYVSGDTLSSALRVRGPLPIDEGRAILAEIASALDYAHLQGIVHRDVKPSNVMMQPATGATNANSQRAILTDFGIARLAGGGTRITSTGVVGTFDYIAPEQIRDAKDVDARADIYSLGVMGFQMLAGRLPFVASNPGALLIAHLQQPAPDPREFRPDLPEEVGDALLRALEKDPDHRFGTAGAFAKALAY